MTYTESVTLQRNLQCLTMTMKSSTLHNSTSYLMLLASCSSTQSLRLPQMCTNNLSLAQVRMGVHIGKDCQPVRKGEISSSESESFGFGGRCYRCISRHFDFGCLHKWLWFSTGLPKGFFGHRGWQTEMSCSVVLTNKSPCRFFSSFFQI